MAKSTKAYYVQDTNNLEGSITSAEAANAKVTVFTAGLNGSVLKSFGLTSTDAAAKTVQIFINVGGAGTDRLVAAIPVPASSGSNGTASVVDVLRHSLFPSPSYDAYGNRTLNLEAGTAVKIAATATLTSGAVITAFGEGGDF